jgi:mannose/fructose/N-acetylgalactosamine-specific phosphotransferase system component IIC
MTHKTHELLYWVCVLNTSGWAVIAALAVRDNFALGAVVATIFSVTHGLCVYLLLTTVKSKDVDE